jgi:hypothetical protein
MMMMARAPAVAIDLIHHHGALSIQQGAAKTKQINHKCRRHSKNLFVLHDLS